MESQESEHAVTENNTSSKEELKKKLLIPIIGNDQ